MEKVPLNFKTLGRVIKETLAHIFSDLADAPHNHHFDYFISFKVSFLCYKNSKSAKLFVFKKFEIWTKAAQVIGIYTDKSSTSEQFAIYL